MDVPTRTSATRIDRIAQVQPQLLSGSEADRYLGISMTTRKVLVSRGVLPSVRIGRRRLFVRADLDRYIESLRRSA